ncbi:MAG: hypothetical protein M3235_07270 [Actinomycetota bacterium]|nr:hypothetical protein [Actinomycetota bacterium]
MSNESLAGSLTVDESLAGSLTGASSWTIVIVPTEFATHAPHPVTPVVLAVASRRRRPPAALDVGDRPGEGG